MTDNHGLLICELDAGIGQALLLVHITSCHGREKEDIDSAHDSKQPVEVVEPPLIKVIG
jgi:hypothetical protein